MYNENCQIGVTVKGKVKKALSAIFKRCRKSMFKTFSFDKVGLTRDLFVSPVFQSVNVHLLLLAALLSRLLVTNLPPDSL